MKAKVMMVAGMALLLAGIGSVLSATPVGAPEIDGATASSALALLGGAVLMIRARKK
jgi:hypothetical protein